MAESPWLDAPAGPASWARTVRTTSTPHTEPDALPSTLSGSAGTTETPAPGAGGKLTRDDLKAMRALAKVRLLLDPGDESAQAMLDAVRELESALFPRRARGIRGAGAGRSSAARRPPSAKKPPSGPPRAPERGSYEWGVAKIEEYFQRGFFTRTPTPPPPPAPPGGPAKTHTRGYIGGPRGGASFGHERREEYVRRCASSANAMHERFQKGTPQEHPRADEISAELEGTAASKLRAMTPRTPNRKKGRRRVTMDQRARRLQSEYNAVNCPKPPRVRSPKDELRRLERMAADPKNHPTVRAAYEAAADAARAKLEGTP